MRLDLGCGARKREGFKGVDVLPFQGVDIVHDLNRLPYPFSANSIEEIWMDNVLEHLDGPLRIVEEIHRICAPDASVTVKVPYFRSYYATIDPTHRNFFGVHWFRYFDPDDELCKRYRYSDACFKQQGLLFDEGFASSWRSFRPLIRAFANRHPRQYEARFSHLFPLDQLTFRLVVKKPKR